MFRQHIQEIPSLKGIPKPYFISTLFPEVPIAICRPLEPPFEDYAITHHGVVFKFRPLEFMYVRENNYYTEELSFDSFVLPDITIDDEQFVIITDTRSNHTETFFVHRLILDRFHNVSLKDDVEVVFIDGFKGNPHMNNLEAFYR